MKKWSILIILLSLALIFTACEPGAPPIAEEAQPEQAQSEAAQPEEPAAAPPSTEPPPPTDTPEPTPEPPTATPEPTAVPTLEPLAADPQEIEFQAADGFALKGRYYPAAVNPAPMIVLHHWAPGDMEDWNEIAFWFQNRGLSGTSPNVGAEPWLDPTWFPPMLEDRSFGVFSFTFRKCENGCSSFEPAGWLMDAQAAMETAYSLEGVDQLQIIAMGASIGADGAPDGCFWLNDLYPGSCLGALSLSPGSYLTIDYAEAVTAVDEDGYPVWCFYATGDGESSRTCKSATGDFYQMYEWPGSDHGMMLIRPEIDPSAIQLMLDFVEMVFEIE